MARNSLRLLAVGVGLALLAGGWWLGQRHAAPAVDLDSVGAAAPEPAMAPVDANLASARTGAERIAVAQESGTAASGASTGAPLPSDPLPPEDTPMAEMFDRLLDRARRGDASAACRLASELQRCREHALRQGFGGRGREMESVVAGESDERRRETMIQAMARMELERERSSAVCDGVTEAQIDLAFPLQMQAAQARPELRAWLAVNPALDARFFLDDVEQWQQYRQVAMPWMEAAAAEGDLSAVIALARVHGDGRSFGPPIPPFREIDDARFVLYATLMERYGLSIPPVVRAAEEARGRLEPAALAEAERQANELFRPEAVLPDESQREAGMRRTLQRAPQSIDCD